MSNFAYTAVASDVVTFFCGLFVFCFVLNSKAITITITITAINHYYYYNYFNYYSDVGLTPTST